MHKKIFRRMFAVLFLTVFALCSVPARTVSAYGLFGKSWINDDSLYWSDGGIGLLPDSFEDASLPSYELSRVNTMLDNMCQNLLYLKQYISLGFFTCGATQANNIIEKFINFSSELSKNGKNLYSYIEDYNQDPGDESYTKLLERITTSNMRYHVESLEEDLIREASPIITAKYGIYAEEYKARTWSWTYRYLYDELKDGYELAYQDSEDFSGEWKTFLVRNPYIGPVPVTYDNVTATPDWATHIDTYYNDFKYRSKTYFE